MTTAARVGLTALSLALCTSAWAGSESGLYLGGSLGTANYDVAGRDPSFGDIKYDDDDTGYKIFAGYNIGLIPFIDLAVEGSYVDFGKALGTVSGQDTQHEVSGFDAFGLAGFKLGPIGLFGKVGVMSWDSDSKVGSNSGSDSGTDPAYGVGARFQIGSIAVRAEYELFDVDTIDIEMLSVGASWTF